MNNDYDWNSIVEKFDELTKNYAECKRQFRHEKDKQDQAILKLHFHLNVIKELCIDISFDIDKQVRTKHNI